MKLKPRSSSQLVEWFPSTIVSGGQTGADRAALDWVIGHGVDHGGCLCIGTVRSGSLSGAGKSSMKGNRNVVTTESDSWRN